jgi:SAM-dependent methyltransferase
MSVDPAWEHNAYAWARFARSPEHDHFFWTFNGPRFLELIPPPGRRTLDLGCGEGRLGRLLAARGHRVIALDAAPAMGRLAADAGEQLVVVGSASQLPLPSASVDVATAFMSLQDMPELEPAVTEVARVLVDGGRFCIAIAHPIRSGGRFESKQADSAFSLTSYFATRPWPWRSQHTGLQLDLPGVHRPLEAYTVALERAGFVIEALREPQPAAEQTSKHPESQRWQRIPCFLHIRALRRSAEKRTHR